MGKQSAIEWTDNTFNPWWGCVRVSPACAHCYADTLARRYGHPGLWDGGHRWLSENHWRQPVAWNRDAQAARQPLKVFCASMADVFEDHPDLEPWREKLWALIDETPWLRWQLLTKRPENVARMVPWGETWPGHVWLGTSIENSRHTFRADVIRELPAAVRFISAEPLLDCLFRNGGARRRPLDLDGIHWVIAGGESGPRARPSDEGWLRELRDACADQDVAFFLKQLGGRGDKRGGDKARLDGRLHRELPVAAGRLHVEHALT